MLKIGEDWLIRWEEDEDDDQVLNAILYRPIEDSRMLYEIARVEQVPIDEDGDLERGEVEDERLQEISLIKNAKQMHDGIKRAIKAIEAVTGLGKPDSQCATWVSDPATEAAWKQIAQVQTELERLASQAVDIDRL